VTAASKATQQSTQTASNATFPESVGCNKEKRKLEQKFTVDKRLEPSGRIKHKRIFERFAVRHHQFTQLKHTTRRQQLTMKQM